MIPQLELYDGCLMIIYLFAIYLGAILYVQKKKKDQPLYRYFLSALTIKIGGGIVYALYHVYIYKGGDTFVFYNAAKDLANYISVLNPSTFGAYFSGFNPAEYNFSPDYNYILNGTDVLFIVKLTSVFYFLAGGSYFVITILFSFLSFLGLWYAFLTFCRLYPKLAYPFFLVIYCVPTMTLWSSGLLKDTVTIGAIGWLIYGFANLFIYNQKLLKSLFHIFFSSFLIFMLKSYLIYLLYPAFFIWVQSSIKSKIKSAFLRNMIAPLLFLSMIGALVFILSSYSNSAGKYSLNNWQSTLQGFHSWHGHLADTRDQSGYSLGEMDYTILGVLSKVPAAINVTFFRPYPWEIRNIATLLGAFEALLFMGFTVVVLVKRRLTIFAYVFKNKEVLFLLSFALPFAFIVGLSSYNFGALSRYKIPSELFYLIALVIIYKTPFKTSK
ncbi:MAG: hypothetical protein N4A35_09875 [Flavobacteriales bacterium]|jgi:hypothetical protein|nr:hypothetical protein [Flavobacteriales bacterium]